MITLPIEREVRLDHRAHHVQVATSGHAVAASPGGRITWITPDFAIGATYPFFEPRVDHVSLSPDGTHLAVHAAGRLHLVDARTGRALRSEQVDPGGASLFTSDGALWTIEGTTLTRRDPATLTSLRAVTLTDPIAGGSTWSVRPHPDPARVAVWAAGGQDGQAIFWAEDDGATLAVRHVAGLEECAPPEVRHDGAEYLVLAGDRLLRIAYGRDEILAEEDEWLAPDGGAVEALAQVVYAGDRGAIVTTGEGLLYLVDLDTLRITDGVAPAGHGPRPIGELYPALADETGLASTLQFLVSSDAHHVFSVHRELPSDDDDDHDDANWRDRLLCWSAPHAG